MCLLVVFTANIEHIATPTLILLETQEKHQCAVKVKVTAEKLCVYDLIAHK